PGAERHRDAVDRGRSWPCLGMQPTLRLERLGVGEVLLTHRVVAQIESKQRSGGSADLTVMRFAPVVSLLGRRRHLVANQPALLALPVALFLGVALVVLGLALGERDLGLDPAALVVEVERHERESL